MYHFKIKDEDEYNEVIAFTSSNNYIILKGKSLIFMFDMDQNITDKKIIKQLNFHDSIAPLILVNEGIEAVTQDYPE